MPLVIKRITWAADGRKEQNMACRGHIKGGVVQPDQPLPWPEGTEVLVVPAGQKSLKNLLGLLQPEGPPPSDEECDQIREAELGCSSR
jgi:hypothetical protein